MRFKKNRKISKKEKIESWREINASWKYKSFLACVRASSEQKIRNLRERYSVSGLLIFRTHRSARDRYVFLLLPLRLLLVPPRTKDHRRKRGKTSCFEDSLLRSAKNVFHSIWNTIKNKRELLIYSISCQLTEI